ncbi:MAG TPA: MarR family winged helix-turn-helix transcriptional regulator [Rhizobiaceae bacterium]|nr:MarR family winged helix-turn-helix transcriptional regulator [Rhizobiaceae bacterium]
MAYESCADWGRLGGGIREDANLSQEKIPVSALVELIELAGRSMHSIGYAADLYPAQWTALRYFAKAPDGMRTASELARFQGFANGPVSRTVRTLLQKGLVKKSDVQPVGRAEHLELTPAGHTILEQDPTGRIAEALNGLGGGEREILANSLQKVIQAASSVWPRDSRPRGQRPT